MLDLDPGFFFLCTYMPEIITTIQTHILPYTTTNPTLPPPSPPPSQPSQLQPPSSSTPKSQPPVSPPFQHHRYPRPYPIPRVSPPLAQQTHTHHSLVLQALNAAFDNHRLEDVDACARVSAGFSGACARGGKEPFTTPKIPASAKGKMLPRMVGWWWEVGWRCWVGGGEVVVVGGAWRVACARVCTGI